MGLLTDTKQRQVLTRGIVRYHQKLSVLFYVVGVVWFLALAYRPLSAGTYFSENALLPGLVESDLPHGFLSLSSYTELLKAEINKDKKVVPKEWIFKQFQDLGLDTYRHNFTIKYPFKMAISQDLVGENIFAILRARRAASTEALVMTAPLRSAGNQKTPTDGSVALMLALAAQFRNNPYWAKDVIFLLTEFEEIGVHAWLDAYHESKTPYVIADDLPGRSGAIQAAINLELPSDKIRYLNMKLEGLNGQLPNLDLFNLAVRLSRREHVPATLHHRRDPQIQDVETMEGFQHMLGTMLHMMWSQASGAPSGNHGLFHRFHIEALTIEGVHKKKGQRTYSLEQVARVVEGVFRSLNNLLERFHQSFFFYLLPSTDSYVSIGVYMPPFGLIAAAGIIKALALWIITHTPEEDKIDQAASDNSKEEARKADDQKDEKEKDKKQKEHDMTEEDEKAEGDTSLLKETAGVKESHGESEERKEKGEDGQGDTAEEELTAEDFDLDGEDFESMPRTGLLTVLPVVMMAYLLGLMAYSAPYFLTHFTPATKMKAADVILYGILAIFCAGLTYPHLMNRKTLPEDRIHRDWRLLKCVGLIVQGLTLFAVSLMNISLAFFMAAVSVPVTMLVVPTNNFILRTLQQLALLVVSPMGLLFIAATVNTAMQSPDVPWVWVVWQAIDEAKQMLFLLLVDQYLFYSWTYTLVSLAFLPTWLLFWAVPSSDP